MGNNSNNNFKGEDGMDGTYGLLQQQLSTIFLPAYQSRCQLACTYPDFEKSEWLNHVLEEVWCYLMAAITEPTKNGIEGALEAFRPKMLDQLCFDRFDFGKKPPFITGVRHFSTTADEVVLEMEIKWASEADVVLRVRKGPIKLRVGVQNLHFFAWTRLTLSPLIKQMPLIGAFSFSFMEAPRLDYALNGIGSAVSSIPGLEDTIKTLITNILAGLFLWPKKFVFELVQGAGYGDSLIERPKGLLLVMLKEAQGLANMDVSGLSDYYAVLEVEGGIKPYRQQSSVRENAAKPVWNEGFQFPLEVPASQKLRISLFDLDDVGGDDEVGDLTLETKIATDKPYEEVDCWMEVHRGKKSVEGKVHLSLVWRPFEDQPGYDAAKDVALQAIVQDFRIQQTVGGVLYVHLIKGNIGKSGSESVDPFVTMRVGEHCEWQKSDVRTKTREPRWDQTFEFIVPDASKPLEIEVWDYDKWSKNDKLGSLTVSLDNVLKLRKSRDIVRFKGLENGDLELELRWEGTAGAQVETGTLPISEGGAVTTAVATGEAPAGPPDNDHQPEATSGGATGQPGVAANNPMVAPPRPGKLTVFLSKAIVVDATPTGVDPYVKLRVGAKSAWQKSEIVKRCSTPEWNQTFTFDVADGAQQMLDVELWDYDKFTANDLMGTTSISLARVMAKGTIKDVYTYRGRQAGTVYLDLTWADAGKADVTP
eukprot:jgi/Mesvir1/28921/Mv18005-RA.1